MSTYAIIGLSCLFPGAETPAEFWHNLRTGTDSRREGGEEVFGRTPEPRDRDPRHDIYCRRGGFVTDFVFDPEGYLLDPGHLSGLDRIFHWSLHVAREALRDSGHADRPDVLARTGLVLGNYSFPTPTSARVSVPLVQEAVLEGLRRAGHPPLGALARAEDRVDPARLHPEDLRVSGSPATVAAAALGLGGPRYALDAACSSALYALKLACEHLASGQADLVLAGGVCAPTRPSSTCRSATSRPTRATDSASPSTAAPEASSPARAPAWSPSSASRTPCGTATASTPS